MRVPGFAYRPLIGPIFYLSKDNNDMILMGLEDLSRYSRMINDIDYSFGDVLYWMSTDQRISDNRALLYAAALAQRYDVSLRVLFCMDPSFPLYNLRHHDFLKKGLKELEVSLSEIGICLDVVAGSPSSEVPRYIDGKNIGIMVSDFSPLKIKDTWKNDIVSSIRVPYVEVDAHNMVPCWVISDHQEFAARTIRPKIFRMMDKYHASLGVPSYEGKHHDSITEWGHIDSIMDPERSVRPLDRIRPGEDAAKDTLKDFIDNRLDGYSRYSNDPSKEYQSGLSPYIHFGHASVDTIIDAVYGSDAPEEDKEAFVEQVVVRKELAQNFCMHNKHYDSPEGFPAWAKKTISEHKGDMGQEIYGLEQLDNAETNDDAWNSAQIQLKEEGKMHGYMRMYWAKKVKEWTGNPHDAMGYLIYLNDRYSIDGHDPNGYAGIAWSVGGVHDRAFAERPVYGKIRYMSRQGLSRKYDIGSYINKYKRVGIND